jgi:hypothetical protein
MDTSMTIERPFTSSQVNLERCFQPMTRLYNGLLHGEAMYPDIIKNCKWLEDLLVCIRPKRWQTVDHIEM